MAFSEDVESGSKFRKFLGGEDADEVSILEISFKSRVEFFENSSRLRLRRGIFGLTIGDPDPS